MSKMANKVGPPFNHPLWPDFNEHVNAQPPFSMVEKNKDEFPGQLWGLFLAGATARTRQLARELGGES